MNGKIFAQASGYAYDRAPSEMLGRQTTVAGDRQAIDASLREEREAVQNYEKRAERADDPRVARVLRHNLGEERQHVRSLMRVKRAQRRSGRR